MSSMTEEQFAALARLIGLRDGSATSEGLRLVLLESLTHQQAAERSGATRTSITRALSAARRLMDDVQQLQSVELPPERNY